jgi:hypothetical protein
MDGRYDEVENQRPDENMPFSPGVGCLISFLIAAIPVCLILGASALALRGELVVNSGPVRKARLWVVREGAEQGLGLSTMAKVSGDVDSGHICYRTNVHFLLWKSLKVERQASYCECYGFEAGSWQIDGDCQ